MKTATQLGQVRPQSGRHRRPHRRAGDTIRVVLYSHDTMGLGHIRRNLLLAEAMTRAMQPMEVLLISGVHDSASFTLPANVDLLTLPALQKMPDGEYRPRRLNIDLASLVHLRSSLIRAAVESFQPDVFIVDNVPRGALRELERALELLRTSPDARCVLGLRDILDSPERVGREWDRSRNFAAIRRWYDSIWVYGDRNVFDPTISYAFPLDIAKRVRFTGYLDQRERSGLKDAGWELPASLKLAGDRFALCLVGGGQDGARLVSTFAQSGLPPGMDAVVLTGPHFPEACRKQLDLVARNRADFHVLNFVAEPGLLVRLADRVVCMGGYNTTSEVLSHGKPALIVPRTSPRQEQLIRAIQLQELGLVSVVDPDELSAEMLGEWLHSIVPTPNKNRTELDFGGVVRVPELLLGLLRPARQPYVHRPLHRGVDHAAS